MVLSLVTFLPALGALLLLLLPGASARLQRAVALATALATFVAAAPLWWLYDPSRPGMQFVESHVWLSRFDIGYRLGIDGLSLVLVMLTVFLTPLAILSSRHA